MDEATNGSSSIAFSKYNENGYQMTLAAQRTYWVSWEGAVRVDPTSATLHKMDKADNASYVYIRTKYLQVGSDVGQASWLVQCCCGAVWLLMACVCRQAGLMPGPGSSCLGNNGVSCTRQYTRAAACAPAGCSTLPCTPHQV